MRRRYTRDVFADRVKLIRKRFPLAGIGADVIVGFPGEDASDFDDTYSFLSDMEVSYLHVFTFSERPGTIAEKLPGKVVYNEKELRRKRLILLSESKNTEFMNANIGSETEVLFERTRSEGLITGFTSNYIRIEHPWQSIIANQIKKVRLTSIAPSGKMNIEIPGIA